jgi:uncharacterized BrkB/YihY/UPF0761 family membrane protein
MFGRVANAAPVRWARRTVTAAMDTVFGKSFSRLGAAKPRVLASAMAYNLFFATVPLLFAFIAIASLAGRDAAALAELEEFLSVLPDTVALFIRDVVESAADVLGDSGGIAAAISIVVALWSGSRATLTLMEAVEVIEGEVDHRSWVAKRAVGLTAAIGLVLALVVLVLALVLSDAVIALLQGLGTDGVAGLVDVLAEPVAALALAGFLLGFFTWAPPEPPPGKGPASPAPPGGIGVASWGFGWVSGLGAFSESPTFAILGSVALVLLWLYIISYVLLAATAFAVTLSSDDPDRPLWSD